ncbi:MAG TPA: bifunctional 4-hydroxy-2-oxoglutarate aldolase/2-dehydro-3-deoxy-phosphogluconate aldolase [Burkholderiales bacterium]|nr:bifunctional 4-hydroxy-2-oxoglutarate aldolase/2-dehydro-3-deoxy-phosphogluconate aldolase [Burkholderiales bacterium]
MGAATISDKLTGMRVVPVLRLATRAAAAAAVDCLVEAGYGTVELTLTTPDALQLIAELRKRMDNAFLIGAGTVLDLDTARRCLDAGADYLVSPCLVAGMARLARDADRAALSGGFTPGEVLAAWRDGAQIVKVFPASSGGPAHLQAIHAVFPEIPLCPTGGVSATNLRDYFAAGAAIVGIGNNIIDHKALAAGDRAQVKRYARQFLELAPGARE